MPNQLFTNVVPQILAKGLPVLRENSQLPRLVARDLEGEVRQFGDTIDVPIIDEATVVDVAPAATIPTAVTVQPTKVQLSLDWWKEVSFTMSDKEMEEVNQGIVPLRATAAIGALARAADEKIHLNYKKIPHSAGAAGTTPFASTATAFLDARKYLNEYKCPPAPRSVVLDPDAEGAALGLPQFYQAHIAGDQEGIKQGSIGHKYGADWYMNQTVTAWTSGVTAGSFATLLICTAAAAGATSIEIRSTSSGPNLVAGDLFRLDSDDGVETYLVGTASTTTGTVVTVAIEPPLRNAAATTVSVALVATAVQNLYIHKNCFAWVSRPMQRSGIGSALGSTFGAVVDPVSGLAFRLEITRQNKQVRWCWDILGGSQCIRPDLGARILG